MSPEEFGEKTYFDDYAKEHNRKATKMRKIAAEIEQNYPELKNAFCKLFFHKTLMFVFGLHTTFIR